MFKKSKLQKLPLHIGMTLIIGYYISQCNEPKNETNIMNKRKETSVLYPSIRQ